MDAKQRVQTIMDAMANGDLRPLFDAMSDDVTWRWMGVTSTGHNTTPDGRRYENNYRWALTFEDDLIREVREYMDTQLVTETFAADPS
jgi:ketosteroid isomerase-like protein